MSDTITTVPFETVTVIDGAEYVVHTFFSETATETIDDKIKRLILSRLQSEKESTAA